MRLPESLRAGGFTIGMLILLAATAPLRGQDSSAATEEAQSKETTGESGQKPSPPAKKSRLARIVLEGTLPEAPAGGGLLGQIGTDLRELIGRIDKAADDDQIDGIVFEIKGLSVGTGQIHELREAIARFQKSGKKAHAYFESAYSGDYQVASACDSIHMPESGEITLPGVYAEMTFFKGLFEMLGIKADFMHVGDAKGAAEPFTRRRMSQPVRENLTDMVDDLYNQLIEHVAVGRKLPVEEVTKHIDRGIFVATEAKDAGLIDGVLYEDELRKHLADQYGVDELVYVVNYGHPKVDTDFSGTMGFIKLLQAIMGADTPEPRSKTKKIAVVYAVGPIFSGQSTSDLFGESLMGSDTIVEALRDAEANDDVVAVVLRIDSPGGSALASDMIWRATVALDKPIVASMGDVAGSGGYYIAMGCDKIYAEPGTITGSIGVVGGKIATKGLYNKVGVTTDSISRGANAGIFNSSATWTESERETIRNLMEHIYEQFTSKAAAGRHMPVERLKELAEGKVYTGRDAKQVGLVDELGTLRDAVQAAKRLAGIASDEKVELLILPEAPSFFEALFGDVDAEEKEVSGPTLRTDAAFRGTIVDLVGAWRSSELELASSLRQANRLRMLFERPGVAVVMPYYLDIR